MRDFFRFDYLLKVSQAENVWVRQQRSQSQRDSGKCRAAKLDITLSFSKKFGQAVRSFYDCMRWLHRKMNGSSSPDLNDNSVWLDFLRSGQKK